MSHPTFFALGIASIVLFGVGCGPSKEECDALLGAMQKTGEAVETPIGSEDAAKLAATRVNTAVDGVAAVPLKNEKLVKQRDKYVDRARRIAEKLRAWKSGAGPDDITTVQLKSLSEDVKNAHTETAFLCKK